MKDLTHYFQLPVKEDKNYKGNSEATVHSDSDEVSPDKTRKPPKRKRLMVKIRGSTPSSNLKIKSRNSNSYLNEEIDSKVQSKCNKIKSKCNNLGDNSNASEPEDEVIQDESSTCKRTPSRSKIVNKTAASVEEHGRKKKLSLTLQKSLKKKRKKKKDDLLLENIDQINTAISELDSLDDSMNLSSNKSSLEGSTKNKKFNQDCHSVKGSYNGATKSFREDTSEKTSPLLDERTNAFHILMSSRVWQSPHNDENEDGNAILSPGKKRIKSVADKSEDGTKVRKKKRKKKLEEMVEKRIIKKAKNSGSFSEVKKEISPSNKTKRIRIIPESESDDERESVPNQDVNCSETRGNHKITRRKNSKMVIEESDSECVESGKDKDLVKQTIPEGTGTADEELNVQTVPRKLNEAEEKVINKSGAMIVEESEDDCSEPEEVKRNKVKDLVIKLDDICLKTMKQMLPDEAHEDKLKCSNKIVSTFILDEQGYECCDSETVVKKAKKRRIVKRSDKLSSYKTKKASKSTNKNNRPSETVARSSFRRMKTVAKNFVEQKEKVVLLKVIETLGSTEESKDRKGKKPEQVSNSAETNELVTKNSAISKTESSVKQKEGVQLSDSIVESKKRNSLFSYFAKVSKDEVLSKSEKFEVKAQVHSPPLSPSTKQRNASHRTSRIDQKRHSLQRKTSSEDQIVLLESYIVEPSNSISVVNSKLPGMSTPKKNGDICDRTALSNSRWKMRVKFRESSVESVSDADTDGESSSDDYIFTPKKKKKWSNKISIQQQAAREVLRKAKSRVKVMTARQSCSPEIKPDVKDLVMKKEEEKLVRAAKPNVPVKLAPLFIRKPKIDPHIIEARKNFLKSGVPEQVKKLVDMQRSMEEQDHWVFPSVAHVQQRNEHSCWNLPVVKLNQMNPDSVTVMPLLSQEKQTLKLGSISKCSHVDTTFSPQFLSSKPSTPTPITCFRKLLHLLKSESPDYPIYRNFRRLRSKYNNIQDVEKSVENCLSNETKQKKRSGRKSRVTRADAKVEEQKKENCSINSHVMWTEKYKPTTADDIVGNSHSVEQLKKWLESWKQYSDEMQHRDKTSCRKRKDSSSGDEFMDYDSNDSSSGNQPNNTAILIGPYGCGKTSAVYAIANELGFKVLEINASSKRNGKRILSELQEATQSHQVRAGAEHASGGQDSFLKGSKKSKKNKTNCRSQVSLCGELLRPETFKLKMPKCGIRIWPSEFKYYTTDEQMRRLCSALTAVRESCGSTTKTKQDGDEHNSNKMSLILVEGVEIVYEDQDEGFVSALNSLVASSKRPVILVTSDSNSPHLARFMDLHLILKFSPPSTRIMSVWLQLLCLVEGIWVKREEIERLLDVNCGDVRQTMLQLQFWVLTGGNNSLLQTVNSCGNEVPENFPSSGNPELTVADDHSNMSWASGDEVDESPISIPEHACCVELFTEYNEKILKSRQIPYPLNLGHVWWNLASLLCLPERYDRTDDLCLSNDDAVLQSTCSETTADSQCIVTEADSLSSVKLLETETTKTNASTVTVENKLGIGVKEEENSEIDRIQTVSAKETVEGQIISEEERVGSSEEEGSVQSDPGKIFDSKAKSKESYIISTISEVEAGEDKEKNHCTQLGKNVCTQLETDSMFRLLETMSVLDIISSNSSLDCAPKKEPCLRSWDKIPKDGTSLNENSQCHWWENSVSRLLCHRLLEASVTECMSSLQKAQSSDRHFEGTKITFGRPTQQDVRWRMAQHTADEAVLPAVPLWCHPERHSVAADYIPMLRAVSRCEQGRLVTNTKRRNRFFHYLKGLNVFASDSALATLCAMFGSKPT